MLGYFLLFACLEVVVISLVALVVWFVYLDLVGWVGLGRVVCLLCVGDWWLVQFVGGAGFVLC